MSTCQACAAKIGVLRAPIGTRGDAIGSCMNCHSLTCGFHGHRDANAPEFACVECDPSLLVASAAMLSDSSTDELVDAARTYHRYPEAGSWIVRSIEDFLRRRPGYGQRLLSSVSERADPYTQDRGRGLIIAAGLIVESLEIPDDRLSPALRSFLGGEPLAR